MSKFKNIIEDSLNFATKELLENEPLTVRKQCAECKRSMVIRFSKKECKQCRKEIALRQHRTNSKTFYPMVDNLSEMNNYLGI